MAKEIDMNELQTIVMEEVAKVEKDLEKVKAKEVTPDEYADTLEHPIDWESKLGISPKVNGKAMLEAISKREAKAIKTIKALRARRKAIKESMEKRKLAAENKRLRESIKKVKAAK